MKAIATNSAHKGCTREIMAVGHPHNISTTNSDEIIGYLYRKVAGSGNLTRNVVVKALYHKCLAKPRDASKNTLHCGQ